MFAFDSAVLTPEGKARLDNMQTEARQAGITSVTSMTIVGHTDPLGSDAYNQKLSEARANSVRDYVVSKGVSSSVIRTEGRGETQLKVTEADCKAKGQAKTRQALIACLGAGSSRRDHGDRRAIQVSTRLSSAGFEGVPVHGDALFCLASRSRPCNAEPRTSPIWYTP